MTRPMLLWCKRSNKVLHRLFKRKFKISFKTVCVFKGNTKSFQENFISETPDLQEQLKFSWYLQQATSEFFEPIAIFVWPSSDNAAPSLNPQKRRYFLELLKKAVFYTRSSINWRPQKLWVFHNTYLSNLGNKREFIYASLHHKCGLKKLKVQV